MSTTPPCIPAPAAFIKALMDASFDLFDVYIDGLPDDLLKQMREAMSEGGNFAVRIVWNAKAQNDEEVEPVRITASIVDRPGKRLDLGSVRPYTSEELNRLRKYVATSSNR